MRKVGIIAIWVVSLGMGLPYILDEQWGWLLACLLAGGLWSYPATILASQRSKISLIIFTISGVVGIFQDYSQVWYITSFVLLLVAWDLDHYTQFLQEFNEQQSQKETASKLFATHLKRLAVLVVLGWCLGLVILNIQIQISFMVALLLIALIILGIRQLARYIMTMQE